MRYARLCFMMSALLAAACGPALSAAAVQVAAGSQHMDALTADGSIRITPLI